MPRTPLPRPAAVVLHWHTEAALSLNWTWFHEPSVASPDRFWCVPLDLRLTALMFITFKASFSDRIDRDADGNLYLRLWRCGDHPPAISVHPTPIRPRFPAQPESDIPTVMVDRLRAAAPAAAANRLSALIAFAYHWSTEEQPFLNIPISPADLEAFRISRSLDPAQSGQFPFAPPYISIETHLPFLSRAEWSRRISQFERASIHTTAGGALIVSRRGTEPNSHFIETLLPAALYHRRLRPGRSSHLHFTDTRTADAHLISALLQRAVSSLGRKNLSSCLDFLRHLDGDVEASIGITLPSEAACNWLDLRMRGVIAFARRFRPIAVSVQQGLRGWVPYIWFCSADRFFSVDDCLGVVTFGSSPPYTNPRQRYDFTYDVLDPAKVARLIQRTAPRFLTHFRPLNGWLRSSGHPARKEYAPKNLQPMLDSHLQPARRLSAILAAETVVVDSLIKFTVLVDPGKRGIPLDSPEATKLFRVHGRRIVGSLTRRLRRLDGTKPTFESLIGIALIYATARIAGRSPAINPVITARFRHLATGEEYILAA